MEPPVPGQQKWRSVFFLDVSQVEVELNETRGYAGKNMKIRKFLQTYKAKELYAIPSFASGHPLSENILLPAFLNCGGFLSKLNEILVWFSHGGTRSVIHDDSMQDNLYCVMDGRKRFLTWTPRYAEKVKTEPYGWFNSEEV